MQDTVTGFLLAGVGQRDAKGSNFLVVDASERATLRRPPSPAVPQPGLPSAETTRDALEQTFTGFVERGDAGLIIINQPIADQIRAVITAHTASVPMVLEIPAAGGKGLDPKRDPLMRRVMQLLGEE